MEEDILQYSPTVMFRWTPCRSQCTKYVKVKRRKTKFIESIIGFFTGMYITKFTLGGTYLNIDV